MNVYSTTVKTFQFELILDKGNTWPVWDFNCPITVVNESDGEFRKTITVELTVADNNIVLRNSGKGNFETILENGQIVRDQKLSIGNIWANGILIERNVINSVAEFFPVYKEDDINYAREHSIELKKSVNTLDFFYNGEWHFKFEQPFFVWYNHLVLDHMNTINHWVKQTHLGIADPEKFKRLENLLNKLS